MRFEAGQDRNMLKQKVKEIGLKEAVRWITDNIESGKVAPEECSIRDMYEALDTTTFPNATSVLINKKVISAYDAMNVIWKDLVTVVPSKLQTERIIGFGASDNPLPVAEGQEYKDSSQSEKYVTIDNSKYGRLISITMETVMFDQTGQILQRAQGIGEKAATWQDKTIIEGVLDKNSTVYRPAGTATAIYAAGFGNLGSTVFGEAGIEAMDILMRTQTDEDGEYINVNMSNLILLIPPQLELEAKQMQRSTLVPEGAENAENIYKGKYRKIHITPYITSSTQWHAGDFKRDFWWTEVLPLKMLQRKNMADSDEGFKQDIIAQFKTQFYGGVGAVDYRNSYKGNT